MTKLNNQLRQVRFTRLNSSFLESIVEADLHRRHRLNLDDFLLTRLLHKTGDDLIGLFRVAGPVHMTTTGGDGFLKLLQKLRHPSHHITFNGRPGVAKLLSIVDFTDDTGALISNRVRRHPQVVALDRIL